MLRFYVLFGEHGSSLWRIDDIYQDVDPCHVLNVLPQRTYPWPILDHDPANNCIFTWIVSPCFIKGI